MTKTTTDYEFTAIISLQVAASFTSPDQATAERLAEKMAELLGNFYLTGQYTLRPEGTALAVEVAHTDSDVLDVFPK